MSEKGKTIGRVEAGRARTEQENSSSRTRRTISRHRLTFLGGRIAVADLGVMERWWWWWWWWWFWW